MQVDEALDQALARVRAGEPAVVRLVGEGARQAAERFGARHPGLLQPRWVTGVLPDAETGAVWFGRGYGARLAADLFTGALWLLDLPWLVLLTDEARDAGPSHGEAVEAPAGPSPGGGEVVIDGPLVPAPDDIDTIEARLGAAVRDGRLVEAAAWAAWLHTLAPQRALPHRWVEVARAHHLTRSDGLAQARRLRRRGAEPGGARLLMYSAFFVPMAQREAMLHAAADRAERPEDRADARFLLDRTRMSHGAVTARALRWPASTALMARMLYFQVEKLRPGSDERRQLEAQLRGLGCALGEVLLTKAALQVDVATLEDWVDDAVRHLAFGEVQQAAFDLAGKTLAPGDEELRARVQRGVQRVSQRSWALPRLDEAVSAGDWAGARALARKQLATEAYGGFMHTVMDVVDRVGTAVIDGDAAPLVSVESEALEEYLQPAFPELVEAAVPHAPAVLRPRLQCLAARWWQRLDHASLQPCLEQVRAVAGKVVPLGDYDVLEPVGRGGMGEVWRGVHAGLGEVVAIKLLRASSAHHLALFLEEVELTARLDHEAIVHVHDAGTVGVDTAAASGGRFAVGTPYLVMEYVPDGTLATLRERLDWSQVRALLLAVLDALGHAHARGVVHRDLKPDNLLVVRRADGLRIRLSDFGLAGIRERGLMSGTPSYMAPEQFGGAEVGPAADLYAVGCLATYLLTGAPPFSGSLQDLASAHRFEAPTPLPELGLPPAVDAWRRCLLAKIPEQRFGSAWVAYHALLGIDDDAAELAVPWMPSNDTFVLATMTGIVPAGAVVDDAPTWQPDQGPGEAPPLPETGFRVRRARPRMPTTRLFARRDPPRVGHHRLRQRLWAAARRAVEGQRVVSLSIWIHPGVSVEPLVHDLVLRLRELGVDAHTRAGAPFEVAVGHAPAGAPALHLATVTEPRRGTLRVELLQHVEVVAWLQAQVRLQADLAWEVARRSLGSTRLAGTILQEVLAMPVVPGADGLALGGELPAVTAAERAWWSRRVGAMSREARDRLAWAAVWVPGFEPARHEQVAGEGACTELAPFAMQVQGRFILTEALRELLRAGLRDRDQLAPRHAEAARHTTGARQALHRLYAGEPGAADALMEALRGRLGLARPPDRDLLTGVALALDLELLGEDAEERAWLALGRGIRAGVLGRREEARACLRPLLGRGDTLALQAWRYWLPLAPLAEAVAALPDVQRLVRQVGEPSMRAQVALAIGEVRGRAGALEAAEAVVRAVAPCDDAVAAQRALTGSRLSVRRGDLASAATWLAPPWPEGALGASMRLARAEVALQQGDLGEARVLAEAAAQGTRGPTVARALTVAARAALRAGDVRQAIRWAGDGLDYLVGTAWPEPRSVLEAVRLAATADRPGDDWELLWLARSPAVPAAALALRLGAERAAQAGLVERAHRLRAEGGVAQPRKG